MVLSWQEQLKSSVNTALLKRFGHTPACGRFARRRPQRVDAEARRGFGATAANRDKAIELKKLKEPARERRRRAADLGRGAPT